MSAALAILGLVTVLIVIGGFYALKSKGHEYGMHMIRSKEFAIMAFGFICFLVAFWVAATEENASGEMILANLIVGLVAYAATFVIALVLNIKKSNVLFGLLYTIVQFFATLFCFILVFFLIYATLVLTQNKRDRKYIDRMNLRR